MVLIQIKEIPKGPAPEWVRKKWVGMLLFSERMPENAKEHDFINGEPIGNRNGFMVEKEYAINCLETFSYEAADWFRKNAPSDMRYLSFAPDEVEVMGPDVDKETLKKQYISLMEELKSNSKDTENKKQSP
ncbi:hypothetical protein EPN15_03855 [Patescibacteria group bacterium]|nr:MAG: hypothetical protein EPN15_03855 [Patescibacteria group bacterium]